MQKSDIDDKELIYGRSIQFILEYNSSAKQLGGFFAPANCVVAVVFLSSTKCSQVTRCRGSTSELFKLGHPHKVNVKNTPVLVCFLTTFHNCQTVIIHTFCGLAAEVSSLPFFSFHLLLLNKEKLSTDTFLNEPQFVPHGRTNLTD